MRRPARLLSIAALVLAATGLSTAAPERSYREVLNDASGAPILGLTVEYIGKAPRGAFRSVHPCIADQLDTDFYEVTWENLSAHDVEFVSGERWFDNAQGGRKTVRIEQGRQEVVEARRRIDMQTEFTGDRVLKAKERREWRNMFLCDRTLDENVLHQVYRVRYLDREYPVEFYRVFRRK